MYIKFLVAICFFILSVQAHVNESIETYRKDRDEQFIKHIITEHPYEFPDAYLFPNLDVELVSADMPTKDGKQKVHLTFKQKIFTYCIDNEPVGHVRVFDFADSFWGGDLTTSMIAELAVAQEHRNKKIGEKLLSHAIADIKKRSKKTVVLDMMANNPHAQKLYTKIGFLLEEELHDCWGTHQWYVLDLASQTKN
jgi:GNAT superfamily N-acetyltransferase